MIERVVIEHAMRESKAGRRIAQPVYTGEPACSGPGPQVERVDAVGAESLT